MRKKSILCVNITNKRAIGFMVKVLKCSARSKRAVATMMRTIKGAVPPGKVLKEIMSAEPKPYNEIITWWVLQGPVIHLAKPLESISDRQIESDAKLSKELENMLRKKRPGGNVRLIFSF